MALWWQLYCLVVIDMKWRLASFLDKRSSGLLVIGAGSMIALAWLLHLADSAPVLVSTFMLVATAVALPRIAQEAWGRLRAGQASIPLLVTLAAVGALVIGETWESAAVSFLYVLGGHLENLTLARTRSALRSLVAMAPRTARVMQNGSLEIVPVDELQVGSELNRH
jgi:Cd2+/Zn2+-exporting ATPase